MDLTKYRIDPAKFALACVQSSPDLTTEDKLRVYKEAYEGYDLKFPEGYATEFGLDTSSIKELKDFDGTSVEIVIKVKETTDLIEN